MSSSHLFGQDIKIGFRDSLYSKSLDENRKILVRLPLDYDKSKDAYPVLYRLDGDIDIFIETIGVVTRLSSSEERMSDMIVVLIENTNRDRDMWPVETKFYNSEPGAFNFHSFIKTELIPYIDNKYRTTNDRVLCGQSLSSVFTIYSFLKEPSLFTSYIACSAGFPDCEDYFNVLTNKFLTTEQIKTNKLFLTYGQKDFLDPDGIIKEQLIKFTSRIKLETDIMCELKIYEDEGHVPFQSLYHGLIYIYNTEIE
jgi:predicted alpha/beta superfamily hydrolase